MRQTLARVCAIEAMEGRYLMTVTLDLMVLYTPAVEAAAGSTATVEANARQAVADANTVFSNSQTDVQLRLVLAAQEAYTESGSLTTDLDRLTNPSDGYMDNVTGLRQLYGADLVSLWVDNSTDGLAGLGWEMSDATHGNADHAFTVMLASDAAAPNYTLAHEIGHNLGAGHDAQTDPGGGIFSYSFGSHFTANGTLYRDVMAYDPGTLVPYFSSPDITYQGVPIGTARENNALTVRQTAPVVARYEPTVVGSTLPVGSFDFVDPGRFSGWAADLDTPDQAVSVQIDVDGVNYGVLAANQTRSDLQSVIGTTDHGFSYSLPGLGVGTHRVDVYALDTTTNTPELLGERTVTITNDLYNEAFYLTQYPDVATAVNAGTFASGYEHFVAYGDREGRTPSPFFDTSWYLQHNTDVAAAVQAGTIPSAFDHYLNWGQREGRSPSAYFDERFYQSAYPDVAAAVHAGTFRSGLEHYVLFGQYENRQPMVLFEPHYYVTTYLSGGVPAGYQSAYDYFLTAGNATGQAPFDLWSDATYLADNQDVASAVNAGTFVSGFDHFVRYGEREGRRFSPLYSEHAYLLYNPDVAAAVRAGTFRSGLEHYLLYGQAEGRRAV